MSKNSTEGDSLGRQGIESLRGGAPNPKSALATGGWLKKQAKKGVFRPLLGCYEQKLRFQAHSPKRRT